MLVPSTEVCPVLWAHFSWSSLEFGPMEHPQGSLFPGPALPPLRIYVMRSLWWGRETTFVEDPGTGSLSQHEHPEDVHSTALLPQPALGTSHSLLSLLEPANSISRTVPVLRALTWAATSGKKWLHRDSPLTEKLEYAACTRRYLSNEAGGWPLPGSMTHQSGYLVRRPMSY